MTFVVDASVTLAWCFDDDATGFSELVLKRLEVEGVIAPSVWRLEVVNSLLVAERNKQFDSRRSFTFLRMLETLPISVIREETSDVFDAVVGLGRSQGISSYDASYIWLATKEKVPVATIDGGMRSACGRLGVTLVS